VKVCPVCQREYPAAAIRCPEDGVPLVAMITDAHGHVEDLVGQIVEGRYKIERIVGKGGMGTVYACRHVVVGKLAAMKVLKAGGERSDGVLQRFVREAQTANLLRSRHIVEVSDFGQLPSGAFFVVMELLEGQDLAQAMRAGLGRPGLVHVFLQVAETLQLAHDRGIVHRDLKPDNVFLVNDGGDPLFVKLLDFGIAKILHGEGGAGHGGLTQTGVILGTPYYMSPEQARAEAIDHRSDVYALGVMMYRAFTGRLPFLADSTMGVLTRHITEAPQPPSQIGDVDATTERMILRCLAKKPEHRYQSMREVAEALRQVPLHPVPGSQISHDGAASGPKPRPPAEAIRPSGAHPQAGYGQVASGAYAPTMPGYDPRVSSGPPPAVASAASTGALTAPPTSGGGPAPIASEATTRGLAATSNSTAARSSSVALVVAGGLGMAAIGAGAAFFLLRHPAYPPSATGAAAVAPSVTATAAPSVAPAVVPTASAAASATASAAATTGVARPRGASAGAARPVPPPAAKLPRGEIRSPFD
jgi:serine/threonine protein kinase